MFNLLPRDEKFFDQLESLAHHTVQSSEQLERIIADFPQFDKYLASIEQDRLAAREVFTSSLIRLDKAFITPIDRDDILHLITEMYGVVDRIAELSQRFRLYRLQNLYPTLVGQSKNLSALANQLDSIIGRLRRKSQLSDVKPQLDSVSGIMELVKRDREIFLGSLFSENADPLDVFKKKELHDLLEEAMERCEEAVETLARVLLKNG